MEAEAEAVAVAVAVAVAEAETEAEIVASAKMLDDASFDDNWRNCVLQ